MTLIQCRCVPEIVLEKLVARMVAAISAASVLAARPVLLMALVAVHQYLVLVELAVLMVVVVLVELVFVRQIMNVQPFRELVF